MRRVTKVILIAIVAIPIAIISIFAGLYLSADMMEPRVDIHMCDYTVTHHADTLYCHDSYLYRADSELWELSLCGSRADRGAKQGALTKELMRYQEDVFVEQIGRIVPSDRYLGFLRLLLIIFNRNIAEYIDLEYREEIAAMSLFCTDEYNAIGTPYERQLNYHAAHDIGHAMQQYMLVGCSSFGVWGSRSYNQELLIGRNFDFFVGDDFAKNKIVTFVAPDEGYRYASIGWAGMVGVLSGMNEQGLTVTINAAKGAIPTSAKTPISILTREILQYAASIEEAYAIAKSRETFVSESILIGSIADNGAAIIEKTPDEIAIYYPSEEQILCTNHYQSQALWSTDYNQENITNSDSKYRYDRLDELLAAKDSLRYGDVIEILRDRFGKGGEDIGIGNEMTLNQSIAHHSVVFAPKERFMWVSTSPWQSGRFVCYDMSDFFSGKGSPRVRKELSVDADSLFLTQDYLRLMRYRDGVAKIRSSMSEHIELSDEYIGAFLQNNPNHYYSYRVVAEYFMSQGDRIRAKDMYERSLTHAIPRRDDRDEIQEIIKNL